jgi:hypothetical protein
LRTRSASSNHFLINIIYTSSFPSLFYPYFEINSQKTLHRIFSPTKSEPDFSFSIFTCATKTFSTRMERYRDSSDHSEPQEQLFHPPSFCTPKFSFPQAEESDLSVLNSDDQLEEELEEQEAQLAEDMDSDFEPEENRKRSRESSSGDKSSHSNNGEQSSSSSCSESSEKNLASNKAQKIGILIFSDEEEEDGSSFIAPSDEEPEVYYSTSSSDTAVSTGDEGDEEEDEEE